MQATAIDTAARFHLSLNVDALEPMIDFLTAMLGCAPKKRHADYAKFEPDELPLVLSLEPRRTPASSGNGIAGNGAVNHLGFRVSDAVALVEVQKRLEAAGFSTLREDGVECCYARQTKFWVRDPEGNLWEIYVLEADIAQRGAGRARLDVVSRDELAAKPAAAISETQSSARPTTWVHRLDEDFPAALDAGSCDEIHLQGTFNSQRFGAAADELMARAFRGLRDGGKLLVHALTTDRALAVAPRLPGPAAVVTYVPMDETLTRAAEAAGFVAVQLGKFSDQPCFESAGVPMRELQLIAWKPAAAAGQPTGAVVYRGPLAVVSDGQGHVFERGRRTAVDAATHAWLKRHVAEQFAFLDDGACGGGGCNG